MERSRAQQRPGALITRKDGITSPRIPPPRRWKFAELPGSARIGPGRQVLRGVWLLWPQQRVDDHCRRCKQSENPPCLHSPLLHRGASFHSTLSYSYAIYYSYHYSYYSAGARNKGVTVQQQQLSGGIRARSISGSTVFFL